MGLAELKFLVFSMSINITPPSSPTLLALKAAPDGLGRFSREREKGDLVLTREADILLPEHLKSQNLTSSRVKTISQTIAKKI
jgi:hypothetical protein